jgi:hypothetical protein
MATTYEKITTTTLGSATTSITFSSIGSGYTDLRAVLVVNGYSVGDRPSIRFNGDTSSVYSTTRLYGDGSSATSGRNSGNGDIRPSDSDFLSTSKTFLEVDVFSYAGSTFKTALAGISNDDNGSGKVLRCVGLWRNTAAITSLTLFCLSGNNFNAGTTSTLYGILKA